MDRRHCRRLGKVAGGHVDEVAGRDDGQDDDHRPDEPPVAIPGDVSGQDEEGVRALTHYCRKGTFVPLFNLI